MTRITGWKSIACLLGGFTAMLVAPISAAAEWHVVQPGETLWAIGEQYKVDAIDIAEANDIEDTTLVVVGSELWIPGDGTGGTGGDPVIHTVATGDTLATIAGAYGVDVGTIVDLNGIESPYIIFPGQEITVPYAELPIPASPSTPPSSIGNIDPSVGYVDVSTVLESINALSYAYGWDPYLIQSLAWTESTWDQRALSSAGAVGVMQLMPDTAEWAGPALVGRQVDYVNSAWDNIETGIAFLSHLRSLTGSDYLALAAYFQGQGSVERDGLFPITREYALGIIESRDLFASGSLP